MNDDVVWLWHAVSADWRESELHAQFGGVLSVRETRTMRQFVRAPDRNLYLLAHGLLRFALAQATGCAPAEVEICHQSGGKPYRVGGPCFSLTHARSDKVAGAAVVAICRTPIGVDIEPLGRCAEISELTDSHYAQTEKRMLMDLSEPERGERIVWLWTAKESVIKATGEGLRTPLRSVVVAWDDDGVLRTQDWHLTRIRFDAFVGTIATPQTSRVVVHPASVPEGRTVASGTTMKIVSGCGAPH